MTRKSLTALVMSLAAATAFALPALAQDATEAATPPATAEVTATTTPISTEQSTAEATAVTTAEATATSTAEVTQPVTATPTGTAPATAEATAASTAAVAVPANAILTGLNNPRGISYDANGNLFVAEAGSAGSLLVQHDPTNGDTYAGLTSKITEFSAAATESAPVPFLISGGDPQGEIVGATDVLANGNSLWVAISSQIPGNPYSDSVAEIDLPSGGIKSFVSPQFNEVTNNPDGSEINSNVNAIALGSDGTLYIVDTGANTIYSWTQANGLQVLHVWKDDSVPTAMAFATDGSFYVSFLGQGIAPNAGKVEHWSADGQTLLETFGNLTAVTDVAVGKDGGVYAVELVTGFGAQGPTLNSGAVVQLASGAATVVEGNLPQPYSLAQAPDGSWAVSVNSTFAPPGSGAVVKVG